VVDEMRRDDASVAVGFGRLPVTRAAGRAVAATRTNEKGGLQNAPLLVAAARSIDGRGCRWSDVLSEQGVRLSSDVFISYSSRNRTLAERLENELIRADLEVWRDKTRIEGDWSREIAEALAHASSVCMLWSDDAARSSWVQHEWMTARALGIPIHVVLLGHAPPLPRVLENLECIDGARAAGAAVISRVRRGAASSYDYSILPGRSHIPFLPNPGFVGRDRDLLEVYLAVARGLNEQGRTMVGLVGLPGMGKTQLAIEFAYRFAYAFDQVMWLQAADPLDWRPQLARIGQTFFGTGNQTDARDATDAIFRLQDGLVTSSQRVLLVMDNVADPALLNQDSVLGPDVPFTPLTLGASVLFTSRKSVALPGVTTMLLDTLDDESALSLLTRDRAVTSTEEGDAARGICAALGNLPLGVVLAAGYLRKYDAVSFRGYNAELRRNLVGTLDLPGISPQELTTRHEAVISATLDGHLRVLDESSRSLLSLIAFFPEASIVPRERLRFLFEEPGARSALAGPADRALDVLRTLNLVERLEGDRGVRLHPIVRAQVAAATTEVESLKAKAAEHAKLAYESVEFMEVQQQDRGVSEMADDLAIALSWATPESPTARALADLRLVLDRERLALTVGDSPSGIACRLDQQLHWRAAQTGIAALADRFERSMEDAHRPRLLVRVVAPGDDAALLRSARGPQEHELLRSIRSIRARADVARIVTIGWDYAVLWDLARLAPLRVVRHEDGYLHEAALAPDGADLWTADSAGLLLRWNAQTGEQVGATSLLLPTAYGRFDVRSVSITRDCRLALCAYDNRDAFSDWSDGLERATAILARWLLPDGHLDRLLEIDGHWLNAAAIDATGRLAAHGYEDGTLAVWDIDRGTKVHVLSGYASHYAVKSPSRIEFDSSGALLIAAINQSVATWDLTSGELVHLVSGHEPMVSDIAVSDSEPLVASCGTGRIVISDPRVGLVVRTLRQAQPTAVGFIGDGGRLLTGSDDTVLTLWDAATPESPAGVCHDRRVQAVAVCPDRDLVLSACERRVIAWDPSTASAQVIAEFDAEEDSLPFEERLRVDETGTFAEGGSLLVWPAITDVAIEPGGAHALVGTVYGQATLIDVERAAAASSVQLDSPVIGCAFLGNGLTAVCCLNGTVAVCRPQEAGRILWRRETGYELSRATASRRAQRVILAGKEGEIEIVDVAARRVVMATAHRIDPDERIRYRGTRQWNQGAAAVALCGNGTSGLAVFNGPGLVAFDVEQQETRVLERRDVMGTSADMSDDGRRALTGGMDGRITLWDLRTGRAIASVCVDETVTAVALGNGSFAAGDARGRIWIGDVRE
jgi:WD40 repeat protein